ncbi:hypothetical protein GCM10010909_15650 [Acidocella aquatica]|uniref:HTH tetR-type domain-containing protein n=1 Tax=Acidocella aquatica TaxID=1922313 RepID=A0ABQ6A6F5_9PROT|nr:TetR/AcrR family transcriptional regulator [Acidocella aquatica]GLR66885.1 hypothetical protein GCM10010909_15650 [Acidocella aquatica]
MRKSSTDNPGAAGGNSRADILNAAIGMFAENPYEAVVIRDIAKRANVQSPTIYHFFKSKNGLYREAMLAYYSRRVTSIDLLPPKGAPPRVRIHALVLKQLQAVASDPVFFQLLQRELLNTDDAFKKDIAEKIMAGLYDYLDDLLAATRFGRGNTVIPTMVMSMLLGYFQVARFQKFMPNFAGKPADDLSALQQIADAITDFIQPG